MKLSVRYLSMIIGSASVVGGCSSGEMPDTLGPANLVVVQGDTLKQYQATADGQLTIYDVNSDKAFYNGPILKDQLVVIDPVNKQVTVNGLAANRADLKSGHQLKIEFKPVN